MPLTYKLTHKILLDLGFVMVRQRGSHEQRKCNNKTVTTPVHKEYAIKTAKSILQQIAHASSKDYNVLIDTYQIKL